MMRWFETLRFRQKLLFVNMVPLALALILMAVFVSYYQHHLQYQSLIDQASTLAAVIGDRSSAAIVFDDQAAATRNLAALRQESAVVHACLWQAERKLMADYANDDFAPSSCDQFEAIRAVTFRDGHLFMPYTIRLDGKTIGQLTIQLSTGAIRQQLLLITVTLIAVTLTLLLSMFFLSNYLHRRITEPLERLAKVAERVSSHNDYSVRANKQTHDDIGQFTDTFNQMLDTIHAQNLTLLDYQQHLEDMVDTRTRELTAAIQELEAFSYSVSHDLRTPVRAVLSFAQILEEDIGTSIPADSRNHLDRIISAGTRMGHLIDDLLDLSRIGRRKLCINTIDLSRMAEEILDDLQRSEPGRAATIHIADNLLCDCDGELARIALNNLLGNAWKYTRNCDHTQIRFEQKKIDGKATLSICDNGTGFDMMYADQLFQPFTRLHKVGEYEGTGIGLATVARIIRLHHGTIEAHSEPGQGACFCFRFSHAD